MRKSGDMIRDQVRILYLLFLCLGAISTPICYENIMRDHKFPIQFFIIHCLAAKNNKHSLVPTFIIDRLEMKCGEYYD